MLYGNRSGLVIFENGREIPERGGGKCSTSHMVLVFCFLLLLILSLMLLHNGDKNRYSQKKLHGSNIVEVGSWHGRQCRTISLRTLSWFHYIRLQTNSRGLRGENEKCVSFLCLCFLRFSMNISLCVFLIPCLKSFGGFQELNATKSHQNQRKEWENQTYPTLTKIKWIY